MFDFYAGISKLLIRRRVPITMLLLTALIGEDILMQTKPRHGWSRDASWQGIIGLAIIAAGLAIRSWAAGTLHKKVTLTTTGPYALCRHPLYAGTILIALGFCLMVDYWHDYFVVGVGLYIVYRPTLRHEDQRLSAAFAPQWREYAATTPALVPRFRHAAGPTDWTLRRWKKNREYQAVVGGIAALAAFEVWRVFG